MKNQELTNEEIKDRLKAIANNEGKIPAVIKDMNEKWIEPEEIQRLLNAGNFDDAYTARKTDIEYFNYAMEYIDPLNTTIIGDYPIEIIFDITPGSNRCSVAWIRNI